MTRAGAITIIRCMPPPAVVIRSPAIVVARRSRPSAWLGWASLGLAVLPLAIMMVGGGLFGMSKPDWWSPFLSATWFGAALSGVASLVARASGGARPGSVEASERGLVVNRPDRPAAAVSYVVPRDEIESAVVVPGRGTPRVALELASGRSLSIGTASVPEADALLGALGIEPLRRRLTAALSPGPLRGILGGAYALALFVAAVLLKENLGRGNLQPIEGGLWLAFELLAGAAWLFATRPPELTVGADGLRVRGRLGSRFVPFDTVSAVTADGDALVVVLRDGPSERIVVPPGNAADLATVARRAELALAARATAPDAPARLALLERRNRTLDEWTRSIADLAKGDAGYRRAPLSQADLEAILAAPAATAEHRLGAALALRALLPSEATPKIRVAAEACASPKVRVALGRVADCAADDDAAAVETAVEEALRVQS